MAPQTKTSSPANGNGSVRASESAAAEASPLIFRIPRNVQSDGLSNAKAGTVVEVQARVTNDEAQDQETASYAYGLLERLASLAGKTGVPGGPAVGPLGWKNTAPSDNNAQEIVPPSTAKTKPIKSHSTSAPEGSPVHAVITKIDRMKTRQGDSLFLKVDVGGETVRVFGRPEELAERLEASGYDIPASEIEAGMELHLPCLVKVGQGHNGYKPGSPASPVLTCWGGRTSKSSCPKLPNDTGCHIHLALLIPAWTNTLATTQEARDKTRGFLYQVASPAKGICNELKIR